jgi:hypothetical protein
MSAKDQALMWSAIQLFADLGDPSGIGEMDAIGLRIDMLFDQKGGTVTPRDIQQPMVPRLPDDQSCGLQRRQHGRDSVSLRRLGAGADEEEAGFGLLLIDRRIAHRRICRELSFRPGRS